MLISFISPVMKVCVQYKYSAGQFVLLVDENVLYCVCTRLTSGGGGGGGGGRAAAETSTRRAGFTKVVEVWGILNTKK